MLIISIVTILTLTFVALIHLYWAFGGSFWIDKALPTTEDGEKLLNPSKALTFMVGIILFGFSYLAYFLHSTPNTLAIYMGWAVAVIFFLRAVGEFKMVGIFKQINKTPFAYYDSRVYIPLSPFWAFNFLILASRS